MGLEPTNYGNNFGGKDPKILTPEILRTYEGLENVSDIEAFEIIAAVETLARILFEMEFGGKIHDQGKRYEPKRKYGK